MLEKFVVAISLLALFNLMTLTAISLYRIRLNKANLWMGLLFLSASLAILDNMLIFNGFDSAPVYHASMLANLSYGAFLILFIRSLRDPAYRFRTKDLSLMLPSAVYLFFLAYSLMRPAVMDELFRLARAGEMNLYGMVFNYGICLYSIGANLILLTREWKSPDTSAYRSEELRRTRRELLLVMLILQLCAFLPFLLRLDLMYIILYMPVFGQIYYIYMLMRFSGNSWSMNGSGEAVPVRKNRRLTVLDDAEADAHWGRLMEWLGQEKPFLNPEYTLKELSAQLNVPQDILSSVIRRQMKMTGIEFMNYLRVQHAIDLLGKNGAASLTIEAIAYDSGFNNRTSFYNAFRRHTGKLPSEYLNRKVE